MNYAPSSFSLDRSLIDYSGKASQKIKLLQRGKVLVFLSVSVLAFVPKLKTQLLPPKRVGPAEPIGSRGGMCGWLWALRFLAPPLLKKVERAYIIIPKIKE